MNETRGYILLLYSKTENCAHLSGIGIRDLASTMNHKRLIATYHELGVGTPVAEESDLTIFSSEDLRYISEWPEPLFGDFYVLDTVSEKLPNNLHEIVQQYKLATWTPEVTSSLFQKSGSTFIFMTHDDGWYSKLYSNNAVQMSELICALMRTKLGWKKTPDRFQKQLIDKFMSGQGLYLEFAAEAVPSERGLHIFHVPNPLIDASVEAIDMDTLLNHIDDTKEPVWSFSADSTGSEELTREMISLARTYTPDLVPVLVDLFNRGAVVKRYKSGDKAGALYISAKPIAAFVWAKLNHGQRLAAYKRLQEISADKFRMRRPSARTST